MVAADLADIDAALRAVTGRFRTAPAAGRSVRFAWRGDTAGQGWGIDATGMLTYATIAGHAPGLPDPLRRHHLRRRPDDGRGRAGGRHGWRNVVLTDAKRKVAETLDEFRGQWLYNLWTRTCWR